MRATGQSSSKFEMPPKAQAFALNRPAFVHDSQDDADTLHVFGEIDLSTEREFEAMIDQAAEQPRPLTVDLTACTYLDSCALHVLQRASARYDISVLAAEHSTVQRVFDIACARNFLFITYRPVPKVP